MKVQRFVTLGVALAVLVVGLTAVAADKEAKIDSGLKAGDTIGAFDVEKCGGAEKDGIAVGDKLCYRCKLGGRPMVMVFARNADKQLASLVSELDKQNEKHSGKKLAAFVNLLGSDADELKSTAKSFADKNKVGTVAIVVPADQPNGPEGYKISSDADITVLICKAGKVTANHAVKKGGLDSKTVKAIIADTDKLVE